MSSGLRKAQRQIEQAEKATKALRNTTSGLSSANASAARSFGSIKTGAANAGRSMLTFAQNSRKATASATTGMSSLTRTVGAMGAAFLTARASAGLFDKTIAEAARHEQRVVTVEAMFGSSYKKTSSQYLDFLQERANISQYDLGDFLSSSKGFISTSKDLGQLKQMTNLAERLAAIDFPVQGIEGASLSLKEFFSGDTQSLVERFELSRSDLAPLKNLDLSTQLRELDKFLDKLGASDDLLKAQEQSTMGQYNQALGKITAGLRDMGMRGLVYITPMLQDFNKWLDSAEFEKLKEWGAQAFSGLVSGAVKSVREATNYINTNFLNNPEFKNLPTLSAKIDFTFGKIKELFDAWWAASGREGVRNLTGEITNFILSSIESAVPRIAAIGLQMGTSLAKGIIDGVGQAPINIVGKSVSTDIANKVFDFTGDALPKWMGGYSESESTRLKAERRAKLGNNNGTPLSMFSNPNTVKDFTSATFNSLVSKAKPHAGGLDNVPYHGYHARLHQGEAVLTKTEAQEWRDNGMQIGGNGGKGAPTIVIQNMTVRNDSDIEVIADTLARKLAL
ncbi:hypothetical protein [Paenibacillus sp. 453mf]|uniref:hypothetical protein n=1 Tax=Paenibacillus sp. 453mf TaxID=1761874 RepID=UPI0008E91A76|nr:hypothetical protein [Paenibacillus sp. 453mf]SFS76354.1 hypothetical protein SAMN04488601_10357 [Paenibacillus sp. 453mf]